MNFINDHKDKKFSYVPIPSDRMTTHQKFDWICFESKIPYLVLDIQGPWKEMYAEALALDHKFVTHRSDGNKWSSLCIHGSSSDQTQEANAYTDSAAYHWTDVSTECPITTDYFKNSFPYESYGRLRFMKLAAGGTIPPHSDGATNILHAINISLNNPTNCDFVVEDCGRLPFTDDGTVIAFNNSRVHAVTNASETDRYHIIVHGTWNKSYTETVVTNYERLL